MPPSAMCRACLESNVRMFSIADFGLQDKFEQITKIKLTAGEGRPEGICFICRSLLQKFCNFVTMTQRSERFFTLFLAKGLQITEHTVSHLNMIKPDLRVRCLKPTSINVAPIAVKTIKKELIEINENTYAETVEMSDILKDFEHNTTCEDPMINNSIDDDISMNLEHAIGNETLRIIKEDENCDISVDLETTTVKEEYDTTQNIEDYLDGEEDCFILENRQPPILIEECDSEVFSESEKPLVIDEKESLDLKQPFIKEIHIKQPLEIEQVDSHKEQSVMINNNNISEEKINGTQMNTKTERFGSLFGDFSSDHENLSPIKKICIRTGKSHLRPSDFGTHRADSNDVLEKDTCDTATYFVPFGYGTHKFNICSSIKNKSQKKKGRKRKEILLSNDGSNYDHYFCDICFNSFKSRYRLKRHMKKMHPHEQIYSCSRCDKFFNKFCDLREHFKRNHTGGRYRHPCDRCRKKYKTLKYLLIHQKLSHPEPVKIYSCDVCSKTYVKRLSYKYHVLFVHPQISYSDIS